METAEYSLLSIVMESHAGWYQNRQTTYMYEIFAFEWNKMLLEHKYISGIGGFSPLLGVRKKTVYLVDKTHLFKISNLVYDGREIVRSLNSSLQGQAVYGGYSKLADSSVVRVKIDGFGNFLKKRLT